MIPVAKNKEYEFRIESVSSEGMGVSHIDGFCVFIPQTVDGDVVIAKILKVSAQSDFVWVKNGVLLYSLSCQ